MEKARVAAEEAPRLSQSGKEALPEQGSAPLAAAPTGQTAQPPSMDPKEAKAKAALEEASRLLKTGQFLDARRMASECVSLTPSNADCHLVLGSAYAGSADMERAARHYRKFLELSPDHSAAATIREKLQSIKRLPF